MLGYVKNILLIPVGIVAALLAPVASVIDTICGLGKKAQDFIIKASEASASNQQSETDVPTGLVINPYQVTPSVVGVPTAPAPSAPPPPAQDPAPSPPTASAPINQPSNSPWTGGNGSELITPNNTGRGWIGNGK